MTDYEIGFQAGERDAWKGRDKPLPSRPIKVIGERATGYWDARLPRDLTWARQQPQPAHWSEAINRYVLQKDFQEYSRKVGWRDAA